MDHDEARDTIKKGEYHPAADSALQFIQSIPYLSW